MIDNKLALADGHQQQSRYSITVSNTTIKIVERLMLAAEYVFNVIT
jgi:hypothetical protein